MISPPTSPTIITNGTTPREKRLTSSPLAASQAAMYTTIASLANSLGWTGGNGPTWIQRVAP